MATTAQSASTISRTNGRLKAVVYAATTLYSALLLFSVQPMIGKAILPVFGGSAAVWANCLLFFQAVLLLGYLYAHWSARWLSPRLQVVTHLLLLAGSCIVLPLAPSADWKRLASSAPSWGVFGALIASVGLPYFVLSTTSPLVQSWFAATVNSRFPYRLYALSNFGSLAALIAYPLVIEPASGTRTQLRAWSAAYAIFVLLCGTAALFAAKRDRATGKEHTISEGPSRALVALWLLFAATGTMLLVAVTNHLCQDVAPAPFLWVLPLALYLLSFVICFDHDGWYRPRLFVYVVPPAIGGLLYIFCGMPPMRLAVPLAAASVFVLFLFCHGELARRKPHSDYLTSFYVAVSAGGVMGGAFVALVAPAVFTSVLEFPIALELCGVLALATLFGYRSPRILVALAAAAFVPSAVMLETRLASRDTIAVERNFYGILRVKEDDSARRLSHGRITHGVQFLGERRGEVAAYYGPKSGAGIAINHFPAGKRRIGVIGLGVATIAAYGEPGDAITFYELNPLVEKIARQHFTFLRDCRATVKVVPGDARLSLEAEPLEGYDVLIVDAFSGDAIPAHLLTREAVALYLRHLSAGGILAVHISNRYLNLAPLAGALAREYGIEALLHTRTPPDRNVEFTSRWALISDNQAFRRRARSMGADPIQVPAGFRVWTDDYSNMVRLLQ